MAVIQSPKQAFLTSHDLNCYNIFMLTQTYPIFFLTAVVLVYTYAHILCIYLIPFTHLDC